MPSSPNYKRDYAQEYRTAKARGEVAAGTNGDNAQRKRARRKMEALGRVKPGQDVDHRTPLSRGGTNDLSNLRAVDPSTNRSFPRTRSGAMKR